MADDFKITARRMAQSSITLHQASEFYNACYLGGYVVECYTKIIIGILGVSHRNEHRIDLLINNVESNYLLMNSTATTQLTKAKVMSDLSSDFSGIQSTWHPIKRYGGAGLWVESTSNQFQIEITLALQYIAKLEVDGLI